MRHLDPVQEEQLKEIGLNLRQRRQELSLPTEEVAAKTYIRLGILKALEDGQSDQLPEPVFIQGLIRRYGDALGLDGAALAKTFPASFLIDSSIKPIQEAQATPTRNIDFRGIHSYVPHIALLAAAASGLFYLFNRPQTAGSSAHKKHSLVAQKKQTAKTHSLLTAPISRSTPIQVTVSLEDESWLRVVADGKTEFEDVLTKGTQKTWTAQKDLSLRAGNAGVVMAAFNGGKPKLLGKPGDVEEVTFTSK